MNRSGRLLLLMITAGVLVLLGCAAHGPSFKQVENIPADKAVIYIYHAGGSNHSFFLQANGKDITALRKGTYYPYITEPGRIEFTAKTMGTASLVLEAKAGEIYYLQGRVPPGFSPTPSLVLVSTEVGTQEIADCKLMPPR
ncbi:MAG: hypothetical protein ABSE54_11870 [Smithella sp.]|jgi:hypothetical protein